SGARRAASGVDLFGVVVRLASFVLLETLAAEQLHSSARRYDPAVALNHSQETGEVFFGNLAAHRRGAPAISAAKLNLPFHRYRSCSSPAAPRSPVIALPQPETPARCRPGCPSRRR